MNTPHANGSTNRGGTIGHARPANVDELTTCMANLEIHFCSECGSLIAHCIVHDEGINCRFCGVVL